MEMTSRERMIAALSNNIPDRVPAAPDISCLVPCKLSKKPFSDILLYGTPSLWNAYLDAVSYFKFDGWFVNCGVEIHCKPEFDIKSTIYHDEKNRLNCRKEYITPKGTMYHNTVYFDDDADAITEKIIKNFKEDFAKLKYLFPEVQGSNPETFYQQKQQIGELGINGVGIFPPGMQVFFNYFQGNMEAMTYAYYDHHDLFLEFSEMYAKHSLDILKYVLDAKPDSVLTGGSGTITLQSPAIFRELTLPTLKAITSLCKQAGVISGVHSCGKEAYLVKVCAEETDLNYINPLEIQPMGDCNLKEIKELYGNKIALMGNLHTTDIMLNGLVTDVKKASLQAILDAGMNGGFVLSSGDQCGRDTPFENIFEMVRVVEEFGHYPLDIQKIQNALA